MLYGYNRNQIKEIIAEVNRYNIVKMTEITIRPNSYQWKDTEDAARQLKLKNNNKGLAGMMDGHNSSDSGDCRWCQETYYPISNTR